MKVLSSLSSERFRTTFLVFYVLSSLIPILIMMYVVTQYLRPLLSPSQAEIVMDPMSYALVGMLAVPMLGIILMSFWVRSLERLTRDVEAKAAGILSEQVEVKGKNELVLLQKHVDGLYNELQTKIMELNLQSQQLMESRNKLSQMAVSDDLTQLFKRRRFDGHLMDQIKKAEKGQSDLSLLMIDVNGFKKFNQSFGHETGDNLLREVGRLIGDQFRKTGLAFRYGGDEFAVILPRHNVEAAASQANKLIQAAAQAKVPGVNSGAGGITLGCSVVTYSKAYEGLFTEADRGIAEANAAGRGRVVCLTPQTPQ